MPFLRFSLTIGDVLAEAVVMKREFVSDGLDAAIETAIMKLVFAGFAVTNVSDQPARFPDFTPRGKRYTP